MEIVIEDSPVERARRLVEDYAHILYGVPKEQANALFPLVRIAFNTNSRDSDVIAASREIAKLTEIPTRAIEYNNGKSEQDIGVTILGVCEIKEPVLVEHYDSQQLVPASSSGEAVELLDERGQEGG